MKKKHPANNHIIAEGSYCYYTPTSPVQKLADINYIENTICVHNNPATKTGETFVKYKMFEQYI